MSNTQTHKGLLVPLNCLFSLSGMSYFYIVGANPLLVICTTDTFSCFMSCLFTFYGVFSFHFIFFYCLLISEREREQGRCREREGDTESEAGSKLQAVGPEPIVGLELTNCEITTWAEVKRLTNRATQVPQYFCRYC